MRLIMLAALVAALLISTAKADEELDTIVVNEWRPSPFLELRIGDTVPLATWRIICKSGSCVDTTIRIRYVRLGRFNGTAWRDHLVGSPTNKPDSLLLISREFLYVNPKQIIPISVTDSVVSDTIF